MPTDGPLLQSLTCGSCGVLFAVPARMLEQRTALGGVVACPNGHWCEASVTSPLQLRLDLERAVLAEVERRLTAALLDSAKLRRAAIDCLVGPRTAPDPAP